MSKYPFQESSKVPVFLLAVSDAVNETKRNKKASSMQVQWQSAQSSGPLSGSNRTTAP